MTCRVLNCDARSIVIRPGAETEFTKYWNKDLCFSHNVNASDGDSLEYKEESANSTVVVAEEEEEEEEDREKRMKNKAINSLAEAVKQAEAEFAADALLKPKTEEDELIIAAHLALEISKSKQAASAAFKANQPSLPSTSDTGIDTAIIMPSSLIIRPGSQVRYKNHLTRIVNLI
jgi:hypothetical protein